MSRAGETVGKAVGTGWRAVRRGAERAGQAGVEVAQAAEQKLAAKGVDPHKVAEVIADNAQATSRRARKRLDAARAELSRHAERADEAAEPLKVQVRRMKADLKPQVKQLRAELKDQLKAAKAAAKEAAKEPKPKRRRWPWLIALVAAGAATAAAVKSKTKQDDFTPPPPAPPKPAPAPTPVAKPEAKKDEKVEKDPTGNGHHAKPVPTDKK